MKKKAVNEPIISPEILEFAKKSMQPERAPAAKRCGVCGAVSNPVLGPQSAEDLCWVCRRLKISAWRESEAQIAVQE
jgi:hypothetical protein